MRRIGVSAGILALLALLAIAAVASAAPAAPITFQLTQPDGTHFLARQYGDERANGMETADGHTIVQDARGVWRYAQLTPSGQMSAGRVRADAPAPFFAPAHLRAATTQPATQGTSAPVVPSVSPHLGSEQNLVLLVRFLNQAPSAKSTAAAWNAKYFGPSNSVHDFYAKNSYSRFDLEPATETYHAGGGTNNDGIVGWLSLNFNHPNSKGDVGAAANVKVFKKAIRAANPYVDFASYDTNADGFISSRELHVTVILAGYEAAFSTTCGNSIWGHRSAPGWSGDATTADGVVIGDGNKDGGYTEFGEQHCVKVSGVKQSHLASIGIMSHEFGHDLGLPDLYDTDYSSYGAGEWSLMSLGAWNFVGTKAAGSSPAMFDAWSKYAEGWVTPVRSQGAVTLPNVENNPQILQLLANPRGPDWTFTHTGHGQYFLVENRQMIGYDAGLPGCGILIWHIDETRFDNDTDSRRLVDLEEADGFGDLNQPFGAAGNPGDAGDPYPGASHHASFTKSTNPNSKLNNGTLSGVAVKNIVAPCGNAAATMNVTVPSVGVPNDNFSAAEDITGPTAAAPSTRRWPSTPATTSHI